MYKSIIVCCLMALLASCDCQSPLKIGRGGGGGGTGGRGGSEINDSSNWTETGSRNNPSPNTNPDGTIRQNPPTTNPGQQDWNRRTKDYPTPNQ